MSQVQIATNKNIVRVALRQTGIVAGNSTPQIVRLQQPRVRVISVVRNGRDANDLDTNLLLVYQTAKL